MLTQHPTGQLSPSAEVELLKHSLFSALTVAKGQEQLARRMVDRPDRLDPARLDAALAEIDRAITAAATDVAALLDLLHRAPAPERVLH